jgi:Carbohydrate-selective porin, OprB family
MQLSRILATGSVLMALGAPAVAYDVNERFSIGGILAGSFQCQDLSGKAGADNECAGAMPLQPEASFRPTERDELFVKLGFASGNGLNDKSPFVLAPWAAYLHDDVEDINGSGRNYLLSAWYRHTFTLHEDTTLDAIIGIIDATDYLDENAYSNDEYTQFMNEAMVNGPNAFLPSYDAGGALVWSTGPWSLRGVVMNVNENDDGNDFTFYAAQLGYTLQSGLGEGNYRVLVDRTSEDFLDGNGESMHKRASILFSFDQQLGDVMGAFLRVGWQSDDAAVNYDAIWSGGINISGSPWKRADDNIGLGYAYLNGGNLEISQSQVAEAYYRFVINDNLALSADIQYMKDDLKNLENPAGFIYGMRLTAEF